MRTTDRPLRRRANLCPCIARHRFESLAPTMRDQVARGALAAIFSAYLAAAAWSGDAAIDSAVMIKVRRRARSAWRRTGGLDVPTQRLQ